MPVQMPRSEQRERSQALIGAKQTLKDFDIKTTLIDKIDLVRQMLDQSGLNALKDKNYNDIKACSNLSLS